MSDMFLNFSAFMERETPSPAVFGMDISRLDLAGVVQHIVSPAAPVRSGARSLVTPTTRHLALMRRDPELREAMETADLVTCGGLPLLRYARLRGCAVPGRITGREIADALLRVDLAPHHRLFFLLGCEHAAASARAWAATRGVQAEVEVAPASFGEDQDACAALADRVTRFGTTILLLGVDAPRGELFAARHRAWLPEGCWALCLDDGIAAALDAVTPLLPMAGASRVRRSSPSLRDRARLIGRYCDGTLAFALSVYQELNAPAPTSEPERARLELMRRAPLE